MVLAIGCQSISQETVPPAPDPPKDSSAGLPIPPEVREAFTAQFESMMVNFGEVGAHEMMDKYKGLSLFPFLASYVQDEAKSGNGRVRAMFCLALTKDQGVLPILHEFVDTLAKPRREKPSRNDYILLHGALLALGQTRTDEAVGILTRVARREFWGEDLSAYECEVFGGDGVAYVHHMRRMALEGIAMSGTERAIELFKRDDPLCTEFKSELPSLRALAKRRQKGIIRVR
ncbi:MAG: hypothetical protein WC655_12370 [Candidatus Hydrogenedentales bacterium]|jgi:hypothetical protein